MPRVGIISQARMTSTRLPGKVLMKIKDRTLLDFHLDRLAWSQLPVSVATTTNQTDEPILKLCELRGLTVFRGDEQDVLSRFYGAASEQKLDLIVRVTSDCPLIDGNLIASSVTQHLKMNQAWLYSSNCLERTFPRGFDFEIFSMAMLQEAQEKATTAIEREHVTPYFYQNRHGKTHFHHIKRAPDLSMYRLTVDETADFQLIQTLIEKYQADKLPEEAICRLLREHPELLAINASIEQKKL